MGCTPWWFGLTRNKQACIRASIIPSQRWFPDSPFRHKIIRSLSINRANSAFGSKIESVERARVPGADSPQSHLRSLPLQSATTPYLTTCREVWMKKPWALALCLGGCVGFAVFAGAQVSNSTVVFSEAGFPAADSADGSSVASLLVGVQTANAEQLPRALQSANTHLLLLPYGSAFPEAVWPDIQQYLQRGGNLLVIGGRPFTRSAYRDSSGWHLRDYSVRFARALMIDQYQTTPGSDGTTFQKNLGLPVQIAGFGGRAHSVRSSA